MHVLHHIFQFLRHFALDSSSEKNGEQMFFQKALSTEFGPYAKPKYIYTKVYCHKRGR